MTTVIAPAPGSSGPDLDVPRKLKSRPNIGDRNFRGAVIGQRVLILLLLEFVVAHTFSFCNALIDVPDGSE